MGTIILILVLVFAAWAVATTLYCLTNDGYRRVPTAHVRRDPEYH